MNQSLSPSDRILHALGGKWIAAALSTAAQLGLADALGDEALDLEQLAQRTGCAAQPLGRLLRVLAGEEIVEVDAHGVYRLTTLGQQLRDGELRDLAIYSGVPFMWTPWAQLAQTVRTGASAFEMTHGQPLFEYLDDHPEESRLYHAAVDAFTRRKAYALRDAFDLSKAATLVDVGGGRGTLLYELLNAFPQLTGTLFERPKAIELARRRFADSELGERCQFIAGDFRDHVPQGADVYVVMHVLHNWDDQTATRILEHCRTAMSERGTVLVIDGIVLPGNRREAARLMDLEMLTLFGAARERTKPELRKMIREAGLQLVRTQELAGTTRLMVCQAL